MRYMKSKGGSGKGDDDSDGSKNKWGRASKKGETSQATVLGAIDGAISGKCELSLASFPSSHTFLYALTHGCLAMRVLCWCVYVYVIDRFSSTDQHMPDYGRGGKGGSRGSYGNLNRLGTLKLLLSSQSYFAKSTTSCSKK